MILISLHVAGFGRLEERSFAFAPGLNVVFGPNESGKSTLANAIVATLYGAERKKDLWRPWSGGPFATTLAYRRSNGEEIEVQRDFERDAKGLRVYDRSGNDVSTRLGGPRTTPGEAHLGIPLDVFLNAACVKQEAIAIAGGKDAAPIATHLARALDGGPRDDAALGAIARLDDALRTYVGTERARKHTPLRSLRARAVQQRAEAGEARARLTALDALRDRAERAARDRDRLTNAAAEAERRVCALRAGSIATRLANLRDFRDELAAMNAAFAGYDDVAHFPIDAERAIDTAFYAWESAQARAVAAHAAAESAELDPAAEAELQRLRRGAGTLGDAAFAELVAAETRVSQAAAHAERRAREGARVAAAGARDGNAVLAAALVVLCVALGFAIAHTWSATAVAALLALAGIGTATARRRRAVRRVREAAERARAADATLDAERAAVHEILEPLGIESVAECARQRSRLAALDAREHDARRSAEDARRAARAAATAADRFDELVAAVQPALGGDRASRRAAIHARAARRRERDGIAAHVHALELRRSTILGDEDEHALESELADLVCGGVDPVDGGLGALRAAENERTEILKNLRIASDTVARLGGEIDTLQMHVPDLAELDERLARTLAEIGRLEAFERAVLLARSTLDRRTREAHAGFARRLETDAAATLRAITAQRYTEIFVDPATLAIRVRVPETNAIVDLDALSAGTRDQTYLVVRFAMARLFADGIETPPLLLDEPFAYWDADRIDQCLPILECAARDGQTIVFTSSRELSDAARAHGANLIDLTPRRSQMAPAALEGSVRSTAMRI